MNTLSYVLNKNPIITSITNDTSSSIIDKRRNSTIIIMNADLLTIKEIAFKIKEKDNLVLVHLDLIKGLKRDATGIKYLANYVGIDGVVTTNPKTIHLAKRFNLITIQRVFAIDNQSLKQGIESTNHSQPEAVEILPGIAIPYIEKQIKINFKPIIIGAGLINTVEDAKFILQNGADGISSSSSDIYNISLQ